MREVVSLKAGINIVNFDTLRGRTFLPLLHGFLDTLREGKPETPILIVSPIVCPPHEDHPGPTLLDETKGVVMHLDRPPELMGDCLTLRRTRDLMSGVVSDRRAAGDSNLYYLDGLQLFGPEDVDDLPDLIHPNEAGYIRIGERFVEHAFSAGGPFSDR